MIFGIQEKFRDPVCLLLIFTFTVALFIFLRRSQGRKLPPGPLGIPILGNLLQIVKNPHKKFTQWAEKYGKLYMIRFGSYDALVITDTKHAKAIFNNFVSTGKFLNDTFYIMSRGPHGIVNTEGKQWLEQRKFCLRNLLDFGFSGRTLEPMILSHIQDLVDWLKKELENGNNSDGIVLKHPLKFAINGALWSIVAGEKLPFNDSNLSKLLDHFASSFQYTMKTGLGFFPSLKKVAPKLSGFEDYDLASKNVHDFVRQKFDEHRESRVPNSPRDFIDACLDKLDASEADRNSSFYGDYGKRNAVASVVEMFIAGSETASNTTNWMVFYLALYPEVQRKVQEEIDMVLGSGRGPSLADRAKMPYNEAVVDETLRYSSLAPIGVIHKLLDDLDYERYRFPKGTLLIPNLYGIHFSEKIWGDPEIFRPERFLQGTREQQEELKENVVPFQVGKRSCIAEHLSRDIFFLFCVKFFQAFNVKKHPDVKEEDYLQPDVGHVLLTLPQKVVISRR